jgi:hypothetical protein
MSAHRLDPVPMVAQCFSHTTAAVARRARRAAQPYGRVYMQSELMRAATDE